MAFPPLTPAIINSKNVEQAITLKKGITKIDDVLTTTMFGYTYIPKTINYRLYKSITVDGYEFPIKENVKWLLPSQKSPDGTVVFNFTPPIWDPQE